MNETRTPIKQVDAAKILNVSASTMSRWVKEGLVPIVEMPNGERRVLREDVEKFLITK